MREAFAVKSHPAREELEAFVLGALSGAESGAIESHLTGCPECQGKAVAAPDDSLVTLLRSARQRVDSLSATPLSVGGTLPWSDSALPAIPSTPLALANHPRYRLVRPLGSGGMGSVWLAAHTVMGRQVALKVIRPEFLARAGAVERFQREVQAAAKLSHPNIVASHDADQIDDTHFLVMEYVEGESLADRVARTGPLPVIEACRAARDAAMGLQHAHARGMVHRDVKPHNLMSTGGMVKVLDFGLASVAEVESGGLTWENIVMGTPDYISPEQAEDPRQADARSDVYSLGCTLYFLLTGRVPFPGGSVLKKLDAHRTRQAEAVRKLRPEVSPGLAEVLAKMMAKDPAKRFQSAGQAADALEPFARGEVPPARRRSRVALAALGFAAALMAVAVYRIQTDKGELVITTESDEVEVVIKQRGNEVAIIDTKTKKRLPLRSGTYELELKGDAEGLMLDIEKAVLSRGKTVLARVERVAPRHVVKVIEPLHSLNWNEGGRFASVDISADGRMFLVTRLNVDKARVYDTKTGKLLRELDNAFVARFTPDSRQVISARLKSPFHVYDLATGKEVRRFGYGAVLWDFHLIGTGTRLNKVTPRMIQIWDWSTGGQVGADLPWNKSDRYVLSLDGTHYLRYPDGKPPLEVIEVETGKVVDAYRQLRHLPQLYGFSKDGQRVSVGDGIAPTQVVDVTTGKSLPALEGSPTRFGHLSGDGNRLFTLGKERETWGVWEVDTGRRLANLRVSEQMERGLFALSLSYDGRLVVFVGGDLIYVYRLE